MRIVEETVRVAVELASLVLPLPVDTTLVAALARPALVAGEVAAGTLLLHAVAEVPAVV